MTSTAFISRRQALQRSFLLALVAGVSFAATSAEPTAAGRSVSVLVIVRALDATLFQIVPAAAYPEDYEAQVAQAEERQRGYEPPLQARVPDQSSYETVFLGFRSGE